MNDELEKDLEDKEFGSVDDLANYLPTEDDIEEFKELDFDDKD